MPAHPNHRAMETDVVIAVMGLTGVGKSSFIKNVTGREDIQIGHGLTSETSEVRDYKFTYQGTRYTLVDTPGFNDTFESDDTITNNILKWLEASYRSGTKLNGILYLHTIAAPKMAGSAFDSLCMFRKLCGQDALKHVVLATTFWGNADPVIEKQRETALIQDRTLWGRMVSAGSKVIRLDNNRDSALKALRKVSGTSKVLLQAQHEMIDEGKKPENTQAARFVASYDRDVTANEYREKLKKRRDETNKRMEKLKKMKETMAEQDKVLASLKIEAERARISVETSLPQLAGPTKCRCKLVGKARCAGCGRSIGKKFYHCCLCTGKTYLHCKKCGNRCQQKLHPNMKELETYCIVM